MVCPKCGSTNVNIQAVSVTKTKHSGCLWWLFVGWWWYLLYTIPALIIRMIRGTKVKTVVKNKAVCQNCGYSWNVK